MNSKIENGFWDKNWYSEYLERQLYHHFPDDYSHKNDLSEIVPIALERQYYSLSFVKEKTHQVFNHLHSDLFAQFIYYISHVAWLNRKDILAQKAFYLNKSLNSINCSYSTKLPDIFLFLHGVGSVLGKAQYSNFLVVNQNVTVGSNKGFSPLLGKGVMLRPNSSVIGKSSIGNFASLSINATVFNEKIEDNTIVIGDSPNLIILESKRLLVEEIFFL